MTGFLRSTARWLTAGFGVAAAAYGTYAAIAWYRYGDAPAPTADQQDSLLDRFMPAYEVVERHEIRVAAPAAVTLDAARRVDLQASSLVRAIIRAREIVLGATPDERPRAKGLLAEVQSLGWGVLAEVPERELVVGAVTRPWEANVTFRALPPDEFASFTEPGFVKIAWTIRAEPIGDSESIFRTETRAVSTDPDSRSRFRRYWSLFSPGIIAIRWAVLRPVKAEAERRARETEHSVRTIPVPILARSPASAPGDGAGFRTD